MVVPANISITKMLRVLALSLAICTMISGTALAQACSDKMTNTWIPPRDEILTPSSEDRHDIMDLLSRYSWSLDDKNVPEFAELFTPNALYEVCNGGGAIGIFTAMGRTEIGDWISQLLADIPTLQPRHFTSNTLLHIEGKNTVIGKTTLLVTLQFARSNVPRLDYTAVMKETFSKGSDNLWRFSRLTLITDTPGTQARAR